MDVLSVVALGCLAVPLIAAGGAFFWLSLPRARDAEADAEAGLTVTRDALQTVAEVDGIRFTATTGSYDRHARRPFTRFDVAVPDGWGLVEGEAAGEPLTGDPSFDARLRLAWTGPPMPALLGLESRRALIRLAEAGGVEVIDGRLSWEREGHWSDEGLEECLGLLLAAVKPLWVAAALGPDALAEVALRDTAPEVRRRAWSELVERHPDRADAVGAALRDDPHPPLRAAIRLRLGDPADHVGIVADRTLADALRLEALDRLQAADALPDELVLRLLAERTSLAVRALAAVRDASPAVSAVVSELCASGPLLVRAAAAEAAARLGVVEAEGALVAMVDADEPARTAAVRALGRLGTPSALPILDRWSSPEIVPALREAVRAAA